MSSRTRRQVSFAYQQAYDRLYGRTDQRQSCFRRDWLPAPADYYRQHLSNLHLRGEWADCRCPLHEDSTPSLSVSLQHGGFICRGCGASGGDVLEFHQRLKHLDFVAAAIELGCWEGA